MIIGHHSMRQLLQNLREQGRFPQTSLFYGLKGCGKKMVAYELAKSFLVHNDNTAALFANGSHPDFHVITPQASKSQTAKKSSSPGSIRTEHIQELKKALGFPPLLGEKQVVIIDDAEFMTNVTANSLLKILEEPKPQQIFILVTSSLHDLLVTIRSRAAKFYFATLSATEVLEIVKSQWSADVPFDAKRFEFFYRVFPGSPALIQQAMQLDFSPEMLQNFAKGQTSFLAVRKTVTELLDKELDLSLFLQILRQVHLDQVVQEPSQHSTDFFGKIQNAERQLARHIPEEFVLENLFC